MSAALRLPPASDARPLRVRDDRPLLEELLARARQAPFHAERLAHARASSWEHVPFTTKDDLRRAYPFAMLAVPRSELATYHESTGTSGEPTSSYFTERDWDDIAQRFARNAIDFTSADTVLVKTPYAMVTTAHQMHRAARLRGALVVPADNRSSNMSYERVLRLVHDLPVTVAWCLPTEALLWAAAARALGRDASRDFPSFRALFVAGEPTSIEKRRRIGALWGARVFEDFGSTETGSLGGECPAGALHLWADRVLFEVLDPVTGVVAEEGTGELVVTTPTREAMPLVRHRLGDTVEISYAPCACGWRLPTVRVSGRVGGGVRVGDREVVAVDVEAAVFSLPIEHGVMFWRARAHGDALEIEIEAAADQGPRACRELTDGLGERIGIAAQVRAVPLGTLVAESALTAPVRFRKPRFLFAAADDWSSAVTY